MIGYSFWSPRSATDGRFIETEHRKDGGQKKAGNVERRMFGDRTPETGGRRSEIADWRLYEAEN
jgi:hypothetical protein